jgi:hypothetical protein
MSWPAKSGRAVPISDVELLQNRLSLILGCAPADGIDTAAAKQDFGTSRWPLCNEGYTD